MLLLVGLRNGSLSPASSLNLVGEQGYQIEVHGLELSLMATAVGAPR